MVQEMYGSVTKPKKIGSYKGLNMYRVGRTKKYGLKPIDSSRDMYTIPGTDYYDAEYPELKTVLGDLEREAVSAYKVWAAMRSRLESNLGKGLDELPSNVTQGFALSGVFVRSTNLSYEDLYATLYIAKKLGFTGYPKDMASALKLKRIRPFNIWFMPARAPKFTTDRYGYVEPGQLLGQGLTLRFTNIKLFDRTLVDAALAAYKRAGKIIPINAFNTRRVISEALRRGVVFDRSKVYSGRFGCPAVTIFQHSAKPEKLVCFENSDFHRVMKEDRVSQDDAKALIELFGTTVAKVNNAAVKVTKGNSRYGGRYAVITESDAKAATTKGKVVGLRGKDFMDCIEEASGFKYGHIDYAEYSASGDFNLPNMIWYGKKHVDSRMFAIRQVSDLKDGNAASREAVSASVLNSVVEDIVHLSVARFNNLVVKHVKTG